MGSQKIIHHLHDHEKMIVKALQGKKSLDVEEITRVTGLPNDSVEKATLWAKLKGVLDFHEETTKYLELTEEGLAYAEDGLPEKRLLAAVEGGMINIEKLKRKIERFSIGLVWVKRNNWVSIKQGKLEITPRGRQAIYKQIPEEKVLSALAIGRRKASELDPSTVERLEKRGLVRSKKSVKKDVYLTRLGKKIAPKIKISKEVGQLTPEILKSGEWKKGLRRYDISISAAKTHPGKKHFMTQVIEYIRRIWLEMGFKEMTGPILEVSFWNFDALYQPQHHPARDLADTFYMKTPEKGKLPEKEIVEAVKATHEYGWNTGSTGWQYGWSGEIAKKCVLRTHTTSLSVRTLASLRERVDKGALPAKFFSVGRCFRNETLDWKHLAEFYQTDGIVVGEDVTFRHLLGYLKRYFSKLGFPRARFRPAYFPYTELSTEIEVFDPEKKEWVELGGSGIFRPEVVKPLLGKDIPVLAWGPGFGRMVMTHYDMKDIRQLYENDLKQLREARLWLK